MLRIINLEEIERQLLEIPALIDRLEGLSHSFTNDVRRWLKSLEQELENNRMPVASTLASLRGHLTSVDDGLVPPQVEIRGRPTRRKILRAVSIDVLRQVGDAVFAAVNSDRLRVAEAEGICRQLVAHGKARKVIPDGTPAGVVSTEYLRCTWVRLAEVPDLLQLTTHIEGLLGPHDVLIVLDRTMTADAGEGEPKQQLADDPVAPAGAARP